MARMRLLKCVMYVVPVVGTMVFGTAQAFTSSTPQEKTVGAWCNPTQCVNWCGGPGGCVNGVCICF